MATSTIVEVQRLLAAAVLSVIGFLPMTGPVSVFARHAPELPLCCRAHGKHKCGMRSFENAPATSPAGPAIYPVCGQYPVIPLASFAAVHIWLLQPKGSEVFQIANASDPGTVSQGKFRLNSYFERSHWKRGPPRFLS